LILSSATLPPEWSIQGYLSEQRTRVDAVLARLPRQIDKETEASAALRYALAAPGKRFRPLLTLAAADIYKAGHAQAVLDCAVAIECIHTASLILDDLPCMDDAGLRRGLEPTHLRFGEEQAILAALALVSEANALVIGQPGARKPSPRERLACLAVLNGSFSLSGLCGGQSEDLLAKSSLTLADLEAIHARKTGALFIACSEIAAILGGANANERKWLKAYAKNLGLAFQIQDDLLDRGDPAITGKDRNSDAGKTTFLDLLGEARCRDLYRALIDTALKNLAPFGSAAFHLVALTDIIRERIN